MPAALRGRALVLLAARAAPRAAVAAVGGRRPASSPGRARARRFIRSRSGVNSFALVDSRGRLHGFAPRRAYVTASVVKAMLLVAYLRKIGDACRTPGARRARADDHGAPTTAGPRRSTGGSATPRCGGWPAGRHARLQRALLLGLARASARSTRRASFRLRPARAAALPRLRAAAARRRSCPGSAGASRATRWRAGCRTFFKGGWRGTGRGQLVHEAALFERGGTRFALAVLTDGNPSHGYGTATLRGVAARLFGSRGAGGPQRAVRRHARTPARRPRGRAPPRARASRRPGLRAAAQPHRPPPARLLPAWALTAPARRARPRARSSASCAAAAWACSSCDAYRPARASRALVGWAERTGRGHLVGTYIARRSRHNRAAPWT